MKVAAMSWFKRALGGKKGRDKATALVTQGYVHAREGRLDEARKVYESAVDADETFAVAHLNLGLCRLDLLNRDAASLDEEARVVALDHIASSLERALQLDPLAWMGWRALARVEERCARFARAEEAWQKLVDTAPKDQPQVLSEAKQARGP
jgi:tetratricopeptide (TPR) repeat protein